MFVCFFCLSVSVLKNFHAFRKNKSKQQTHALKILNQKYLSWILCSWSPVCLSGFKQKCILTRIIFLFWCQFKHSGVLALPLPYFHVKSPICNVDQNKPEQGFIKRTLTALIILNGRSIWNTWSTVVFSVDCITCSIQIKGLFLQPVKHIGCTVYLSGCQGGGCWKGKEQSRSFDNVTSHNGVDCCGKWSPQWNEQLDLWRTRYSVVHGHYIFANFYLDWGACHTDLFSTEKKTKNPIQSSWYLHDKSHCHGFDFFIRPFNRSVFWW